MTTKQTPTSAAAFRGAPRWAKWAAKDKSGAVYWYRSRPNLQYGPGYYFHMWVCAVGDCEYRFAAIAIPGPWRDSLRKRPATKRGKR